MFNSDTNFLEEVGLSDLPAHEKESFLEYVNQELAERVGSRLTATLNSDQIEEFELIANADENFVGNWLEDNMGEYSNKDEYINFSKQRGFEIGTLTSKAEYAAYKWFEKNLPNNQQIVAEEIKKLKDEIVNNRDTILGS